MNHDSVRNRCWYRVSVTIRENEQEMGRNSICIYCTVDKKQTVTMGQYFKKKKACDVQQRKLWSRTVTSQAWS